MNNVELARTLSWRELEIANTELWAKWKGKTHFSRNEKERFIQANISFYSKPTCHAKAFLHLTQQVEKTINNQNNVVTTLSKQDAQRLFYLANGV